MKGNNFGLLPCYNPPSPSDILKASECHGTEISQSKFSFHSLLKWLLSPISHPTPIFQGFFSPSPFLWSHYSGACIISCLESTVWSQSGLSASLGSANKLGSGGHPAGELEACKPLTPFLLVFTIHTISGAGMPSQRGPPHCLVTKIL